MISVISLKIQNSHVKNAVGWPTKKNGCISQRNYDTAHTLELKLFCSSAIEGQS